MDGLAIATLEKALLDQLYLVSRGKATLDESELNLKGLSKTRLLAESRPFSPPHAAIPQSIHPTLLWQNERHNLRRNWDRLTKAQKTVIL